MKPTIEQIRDEELGDPVDRFSDTSWRHGENRIEVYHRERDNTFWEVRYQVSGPWYGETNGLRDGYVDGPDRVYPKTVLTTKYVSELPKPKLVGISGKCSDMCNISLPGANGVSGYVPSGCGIGGGDYLGISVDADTGVIVGWNFPELLAQASEE